MSNLGNKSDIVDKWDEEQFKVWCDYHYSVCREESILGTSNHVMIVGKKWERKGKLCYRKSGIYLV